MLQKVPKTSAKISDDLFLVIDHYFKMFRFPAVNFLLYPPISPVPVQFTPILQVPPIFQMFLH